MNNELLDDAVVVYHEQRLPEFPSMKLDPNLVRIMKRDFEVLKARGEKPFSLFDIIKGVSPMTLEDLQKARANWAYDRAMKIIKG